MIETTRASAKSLKPCGAGGCRICWSPPTTSVGETITLARARGDHGLAVRVGEYLYGEKIARIHWTTPEQERAAFAYFAKHQDKHYSFIDCLSFVVMDAFGIAEAWAVDSDFSHRFVVRPGPSPR